MSHQVRVKTQIKNLSVLKQVLEENGFAYTENGQLVDYYGNSRGTIDLLVNVGSRSDRVGFKFNEEDKSYDLVGDFHAGRMSEMEFRKTVTKSYTLKLVKAKLQTKRFSVYRETVESNGAVKILARSMVA